MQEVDIYQLAEHDYEYYLTKDIPNNIYIIGKI